MRTILTSMALLALCACDAAEKNVTEPTEAAGNVTNYVAEVVALPERQRNAVFFRAIRDAGLPCQSVTGAEQTAAGEKAPMWRAQCEDGVAHLIQVLPDGTANVVSRATP
ncbi:hypothetical protein sphantq_00485 [Sphingobium sp. AntQ-1]|uniref:Lipoprotein n=2 Tax=Alphaproteobacteria TaxID=28211 RepID=A0A1S1HI11_9SPHN|nr:hypothetical protein BHE75_03728 [Sphingomonas haloaromaticamans]WCP12088.1 hypothetical protein sphantq_00485 [Sphingobium sp. AntQ-1]